TIETSAEFMLVSWKWLSKYVDLSMPIAELEDRFSFSGLNHEGTETIPDAGGEPNHVIDLEVTSNRGDCLGHLGVAREVAVLYNKELCRPAPQLSAGQKKVSDLLSIENRFLEACPRYTARVVLGVRVGPSPAWLVEALNSVGIASVNNVVDATNFVMLECGQPLHAFDHAKLEDQKIIVRPAEDDESLEAIDHREYKLSPSMCVIADAARASAVAGVMGGAHSEVNAETRDLVIEAAVFTPLSVRRTARALKLHSPSSFRFERRVDPVGVEWASRRCCELIVELAGGEVCEGILDSAPDIPSRDPIELRPSQISRILGITIDSEDVSRILNALGCESGPNPDSFIPPSWRHDLTREIDLIEEVARIHGYEKIPEDSPIHVAPSRRRSFDAATERVREILTASGISEAMTPSVVNEKLDAQISPWTDRQPLQTQTAMLDGSKILRRSLLPSLLQSRARNWAASSLHADLFEIAHVYLPGEEVDDLPRETYALGVIAGGDFYRLKGIVESLCDRLGIVGRLTVALVERQGFAPGTSIELSIQTKNQESPTIIGYMGSFDAATTKAWKLPDGVHAAELSLPALLEIANLVTQQQQISAFPSINRDLNFIVAESVRWGELETVVRAAVDENLTDVRYQETYRDAQRDGADTKRVLLSLELQSQTETLSGSQADVLVQKVIAACNQQLDAKLLQ
ncbi:MAG: phenylalanine--tRNA ligase subunit beta, partial [Planctomycetota bacterium]